jgi:hypothetical protein
MIALHPLNRVIGLGVCAAVAVLSLPVPVVFAQQVGTAAAVNPAAQARGSGAARTIVIGQSIAHRERIQTTASGSVQLLFLDKTSMTIGPNSDLAIDEYVYDPQANTGKLAATLSKGVMRFVGGQISHGGNAQITTPNAVVGVRGGVGIFNPNSVYIGYGEGTVTSGAQTVTLGAGEFTQTLGRGTPPTNPTSPPPGFIQALLTALQSQPGQGGGARATAGQINQARTNASGTPVGNIATNVQNAVPTNPNAGNQNAASSFNQTIQTTANQTRAEQIAQEIPNNNNGGNNGGSPVEPQYLQGWGGGLVRSFNQSGPIGALRAAFGAGVVETDAQGNTVAVYAAAPIANGSYTSYNYPQPDEFTGGAYQFGPKTGTVQVNPLTGLQANVLLPTTTPDGQQVAVVNGQVVNQFNGGFVEVRPGTALAQAASQAVGTQFCQCDYTKWGLWTAETTRTSNGTPIRDNAEMFWVAGRLPGSASDVPTTGSATYTGHAIANIANNGQSYVAAGQFQNTVNFATRVGNVTVNGLDSTNYAGQVNLSIADPRYFVGSLSGVNNTSRTMELYGSFFQGRTSPVGEMGGGLTISGYNYTGGGVFLGKMQ